MLISHHLRGLLNLRSGLILGLLLATGLMVLAQNDAAIPVESLRVVDTQEIDLFAGPVRTTAVLAPDGTRFAYLGRGNSLCIISVDGDEQACADLDGVALLRNQIDTETIYWSPDGQWVTFTTNALQLFRDSDIWVINADTGRLTNLTDDGTDDMGILSDGPGSDLDLSPRWLPDGRIVFLRYSIRDGEGGPPLIFAVAPEGGEPEALGTLPHSENSFMVITIIPTPDGESLIYPIGSYAGEARGIWMSDLSGDNARRLDLFNDDDIRQNRQFNDIVNVLISPDGAYLMPIGISFEIGSSAEESLVRYVEVGADEPTAQLITDLGWVMDAGWSPNGNALAYIVRNLTDDSVDGLYLASGPGEPGRRVLEGGLLGTTSLAYQGLHWASNNIILLTQRENQRLLVVRLGE